MSFSIALAFHKVIKDETQKREEDSLLSAYTLLQKNIVAPGWVHTNIEKHFDRSVSLSHKQLEPTGHSASVFKRGAKQQEDFKQEKREEHYPDHLENQGIHKIKLLFRKQKRRTDVKGKAAVSTQIEVMTFIVLGESGSSEFPKLQLHSQLPALWTTFDIWSSQILVHVRITQRASKTQIAGFQPWGF